MAMNDYSSARHSNYSNNSSQAYSFRVNKYKNSLKTRKNTNDNSYSEALGVDPNDLSIVVNIGGQAELEDSINFNDGQASMA